MNSIVSIRAGAITCRSSGCAELETRKLEPASDDNAIVNEPQTVVVAAAAIKVLNKA